MKSFLLVLGVFASFSSPAWADKLPVDILDRPNYDPDKPFYETYQPNWAVGFRFTFPNFPYIAGHPSIYSIFAEKMLPFQQAGIFSGGVHIGSAALGFGPQMINLGASIRYQLYLVRNQLIVPTGALIYDNFRFAGQASNSFGAMLGAMLSLNFFEPSAARQGHQSIQLLRSYLTVEFRPQMTLTSGGSSLLVGNAFYFGVRMELE